MRWSSFGNVAYGYRKIRMHFPLRLRRTVDEVLYPEIITKKQIATMEHLGASLGLKKYEIFAATNLPIDNMQSVGRGKISLFGLLVSIIVVVCISIGLTLLLNNFHFFDLTPTYTYTPGTRYGSISPNDFK
ncbi:MAG: hypothetical protein E4H14_11390 [Candidatus Thorarchaeota archaeon]|nr:MAG: hypothetical protein E4H14_11390 [Candidatus Thorarchaeota archaeon]